MRGSVGVTSSEVARSREESGFDAVGAAGWDIGEVGSGSDSGIKVDPESGNGMGFGGWGSKTSSD